MQENDLFSFKTFTRSELIQFLQAFAIDMKEPGKWVQLKESNNLVSHCLHEGCVKQSTCGDYCGNHCNCRKNSKKIQHEK